MVLWFLLVPVKDLFLDKKTKLHERLGLQRKTPLKTHHCNFDDGQPKDTSCNEQGTVRLDGLR